MLSEPSTGRMAAVQAEIDAVPAWYHTIEVAPGVATPGYYDFRGVVDRLPWPDVVGRRCLDVGTFDGFLAFELEKRGAAEVVAVDLDDYFALDWPADYRFSGPEDPRYATFVAIAGAERGLGFRTASKILGSRVERRVLNVYDLTPAEVGRFDVVVCGDLLLHLRDPIRALEAIRSVCRGAFLSSETIELWLSILGRRRPWFRLEGSGVDCRWWLPNSAGHQQLLRSAGFTIERSSKPFVVPFNRAPGTSPSSMGRAERLVRRLVAGSAAPGALHRGLLAR
jgi:tRNA (mo5U34)-methyltransferase